MQINNKYLFLLISNIIFLKTFKIYQFIFLLFYLVKWGLGIGDWGLGIGDWGGSCHIISI